MTKPLVVFADPELLVNYFKTEFTGRAEAYVPATVSVNFPTSALTGNATHLQVELEAEGSQDYPVLARAQVRLTAYAAPGKRSNAKNLASLALGIALAHPGDEDVSGVFPILGRSDVTDDPTTKNVMCWGLVRADIKATQLAS